MLSPEIDALVCELGASLPRSQRAGFEAAAYRVLADIPHLGPGSAWRALAQLQRDWFVPVPDQRAGEPRHYSSKLKQAEPIGEPSRPDRARVALWQRSAG